jgi:hypothetical protein
VLSIVIDHSEHSIVVNYGASDNEHNEYRGCCWVVTKVAIFRYFTNICGDPHPGFGWGNLIPWHLIGNGMSEVVVTSGHCLVFLYLSLFKITSASGSRTSEQCLSFFLSFLMSWNFSY